MKLSLEPNDENDLESNRTTLIAWIIILNILGLGSGIIALLLWLIYKAVNYLMV
jgi:hypothetical protein